MNKAFENSCFKGCLVYLVALVGLVVLGTVGLGSLGTRFGVGAKPTQPGVTTLTTSQQRALDAQTLEPGASGGTPQPVTVQIGAGADIGVQNAKPSVQATVVVTIQQPQITVGQLQPQPQPGASAPPLVQAQAEGISGQASAPFYIVQGGDSLWSIANRFGTTVEALKAANHLENALIMPNQLLYLPQAQPQQQPQGDFPAQPPDGSADPPTGALPSMPDTGINKRP